MVQLYFFSMSMQLFIERPPLPSSITRLTTIISEIIFWNQITWLDLAKLLLVWFHAEALITPKIGQTNINYIIFALVLDQTKIELLQSQLKP